MRKRSIFLLVAVGLTLVLLYLVAASRYGEPSFEGKKLSQWMLQWNVEKDPVAHRAASERAVRAIGTNAIPHFIRWIATGKTTWQNRLLFPNSVYQMGHIGFSILGEAGAPAIPELERLLLHTNTSAADSLGFIGAAALRPLMMGLTNPSPEIRCDTMLYGIAKLGTNALPAIPILLNALKDAEPIERFWAATTLAAMQADADRTVPALAGCLHSSDWSLRRAAVDGLGGFGPRAASALPELRACLSDPEEQVRESATNALAKITP